MTDTALSPNSRAINFIPGRQVPPLLSIPLAAIAIIAIVWGQKLVIADGPTFWSIGIFGLGASLVVALAWPSRYRITAGAATSPRPDARETWPWLSLNLIPLALGIIAIAISFHWASTRSATETTTDITLVWFIGLVLLLIAAGWGRWKRWAEIFLTTPILPRSTPGKWVVGLSVVVILAAGIARFALTDRFPTIVDSDEGFFLTQARAVYVGDVPNPFTANVFGMSNVFALAQAWFARIFGEDLASYRLASATLGFLSVVGTWLLGRRIFGETIGLLAGAIIAFMPLHLWASRNGLNNITDAFAIAFALYFLDRATTNRSRLDALLCGAALGVGWHGYFGSRPFVGIIAGCIALGIILPGVSLRIVESIRLLGWMLLGLAGVTAPILGYYWSHQDIFLGRLRTVSSSGAGSSLFDRVKILPDALLYPWVDQTHGYAGVMSSGFYRFGPPFLGWAVAPMVAIGAVAWIAWFAHSLVDRRSVNPRSAPLLASWMIISVAISQTEGMEAQRQLALTVIWSLAAATGIAVSLMALRITFRLSFQALQLLAVLALIGIPLWQASTYFTERQQMTSYGNVRNATAWDIAWRIDQLPESPTLLYAGLPDISYRYYGSWQFLNPDLGDKVTDLEPFADPLRDAPVLGDNQLLVVGPERDRAELCGIQQRNPTAHIGESRNLYGDLLYTVFSTGDDLILPTTESPGQTTLFPVSVITCQENAT